jgi:hypothetical protein
MLIQICLLNLLAVQAVAAAVQAAVASRALEDAAQPKFDYDANSLYYCGSQEIARTCKIGWNNLDASTNVRAADCCAQSCVVALPARILCVAGISR